MIALPAAVRTAIDRLEAAGYPAWAVGGCVRDKLQLPAAEMQTIADNIRKAFEA